jgi:hypothetical protein
LVVFLFFGDDALRSIAIFLDFIKYSPDPKSPPSRPATQARQAPPAPRGLTTADAQANGYDRLAALIAG